MKKTALALIPFCLGLTPCSAQDAETAPAPAEAPAAAENDAVELFCRILDSHAAQQLEIAKILSTVKDKETADAAAARLEACMKRTVEGEPDSEDAYDALVTAVEKQGGNVAELLTKHFDDKVEAVFDEIQGYIQALIAQQPPFYGSEALEKQLGQKPGQSEAQDAESEDDSTTEAAEDESLLQDILEYSPVMENAISQLVNEAKDAEAAGKAAPQVAEFCYRMVADILLAESNSDKEAYAEALPQLYAAASRVLQLDTHGSDTLRLALWGAEELATLKSAQKDTEDFAWYLDSRYFLPLYVDQLKGDLKDIHDTAAADAASKSVALHINLIRKALAEAEALGEGFDKATCEAWMKLALGATAEEDEATVRKLISDCGAAETPYFGSEKLKEALLRIDVPYNFDEEDYEDEDVAEDTASDTDSGSAPYTAQQFEIGCSYMDEALSKVAPLKEALLAVKDRETADAAAPKVITLRNGIDAVWAKMAEWIEQEGISDELGAVLIERYADKLKQSDEVDEVISTLQSQIPPFYGSQALYAALLMADEDEGESEQQ